MTSKTEILNKLWKAPASVIDQFNLVYTTDAQLKICRSKNGKKFLYTSNDKNIEDTTIIERIKSLGIPPAWQKVKISILDNGHLQAVGRDLKKRKQYRYHPDWNRIRNQTKFYRMNLFGQKLSSIRVQVEKDLNRTSWDKQKILALVVKLMDETHIRIGNEQYAKRNKTYGLATMRKKHVEVYRDKIKFHFIGKRGKEHQVTLRNKKLTALVNRCEEIPGWELFHYFDNKGNKQTIDSGMVNSYIQQLSGESFTAKDFRTWAASLVFYENLRDCGYTINENQQHKNIIESYKSAAKALGNTPNVCKKYYVHPHIVDSYKEESSTYFFEEKLPYNKEDELSTTEVFLLKLLDDYQPNFLNS